MTLDDLQREKLLAEIEKIKSETSKTQQDILNQFSTQQKTQEEINKLQQETKLLKKPWFRQASFLNLLVSFSVPILTLLAAYFLGGGKEYFDAQTLNLQNQKRDLEQEVQKFKEKKDSLNSINISLSKENNSLVNDRDRLTKDTVKLAGIAQSAIDELKKHKKESINLTSQVDSLLRQKTNLINQNNRQKDELQTKAFNEYFKQLLTTQYTYSLSVNSNIFESLKNSIDSGGK